MTHTVDAQAVIAALDEQEHGFVLFDADDRLAFSNAAHAGLFPKMANLMVPGALFADIIRGGIEAGQFDLHTMSADRFLASGLSKHETAHAPIELLLEDGRWLKGDERRLRDGSWLILWSDVTNQKRRENALSRLLAARYDDGDFAAAAAAALAEGLGYRWGAITEDNPATDSATTLAFFDNGVRQENVVYPLRGSPCEVVHGEEGYCYIADDVAAVFPADTMLREIGANTYYGALVRSGDGRVLGNMFAMHDGPDPSAGGGEDFVRLIARWAGIEFDRHATRKELQRRTSLFMDFAATSSDWLWETDADLRFTRLASAAGWMEEDHLRDRLGMTPFEIGMTESEADGWASVRADMENQQAFRDFVFPTEDKKGRRWVYRVNGKPLHDEDGGFIGFRGTATDITERVRAEEMLSRQTDAMQAVFDNMDEGVSLVDSSLRLRAWNHRFAELLEFPQDMCFRGATFESFVRYNAERGEYGDSDIDELVEARVALAGKFEAHTFERTREDGTIIEVRGTPIPGGGFVTIYADVTKRRQAEEQLRESEERFALAVAGAQDGLWDWNPETDDGYMSPRAAELLGYAADEPPPSPQDWSEAILDEDVPAFHAALIDHFKGKTPNYEVEYRVRRRDGDFVWILARGLGLRDETGRVYRMSGSLTDITARKATEALALSAQKNAEAASRTKTEFLANISHELRTPLNAVIGFSEIMTTQMFGPLGHPSYMDYARDIHESGTHLLDVINDILDVSKAEVGKFELDEEVVDLEATARASIRLVLPRADAAGVSVAMDPGLDIPAVIGDSRRLKQILLNLLSNAVKFTPDGGAVTLTLSVSGNGCPQLTVSDNGIGMKPDEIERALEPFAQLDSRLSRRFDGTGLGLPLARTLTEVHGGTLLVESSPGEGTKVTVQLPAGRIVSEPDRVQAAQ